MNELIKTKRYESGEDFLKDISYDGEMYQNLNSNFVYRGLQSGSDISDNVVKEDDPALFDMLDTEFLQTKIEYFNLKQFFDLCDKSSLRLPVVERIRQALYSFDDIVSLFINQGEWLPVDLYELAALAQHYGMETRLLDWTMSIDTAIYFAVHKEPELTKTEREKIDSQYIVIWALSQTVVLGTNMPLEIIRPPYFGNPNLAAQRGLFTLWKVPALHLQTGKAADKDNTEIFKRLTNRSPLDELIAVELENQGLNDVVMWKLLIPRKDRKVLYEYIRRRNVSAASLFPGYGGVVRALKEDKEIRL
jgi:hypothetical protein